MQILKKIYLCGIKPTRVHLGHLFSVIDYLNNLIADDIYVLLADSHKLSTELNVEKINNLSKNIIPYLNSNIKIYNQSEYLNIYFECYIILSALINPKELNKVFELNKKFSHNNFLMYSYPLIMALDVLLMAPCNVIVGEDQIHNIRFIKLLIDKVEKYLNIKFDISFKILNCKIKNLLEDSKMSSTTQENLQDGCIYIDSDNNEVEKKIMMAKTQSDLPISLEYLTNCTKNLYSIYSHITNKSIEELFNENKDVNFSKLKRKIIEELCIYLENKREKAKIKINIYNTLEIKKEILIRQNYNADLIKKSTREY